MSFDNLGLDRRMLDAVGRLGYTEPTPIQRDAIPLALAGRDVVGCAQTGTGKTAAFILPTLQRISAKPGKIRALVVTPTRELAGQIEQFATQIGKTTRHRVAVAYGGVGYEPQRKALRRGVDLLVACPGRLLDLVNGGHCDLSASRYSCSTRLTACSTWASGPTCANPLVPPQGASEPALLGDDVA